MTKNLEGAIIEGKFEVKDMFAHGNWSYTETYSGIDLTTNEPIVIKIIPSTPYDFEISRELIERESYYLWKLEGKVSPALIKEGVYEDNGIKREYFIQQYLEGESLRNLYAKRKNSKQNFSEYELIEIATGVLNALGYAHSLGIWHRDLKPENVIFCNNDEVKLIDWGLSTTMTKTFQSTFDLVGTYQYMAPEAIEDQTDSPTKQNHRMDIYSLGMTIYEFATFTQALPFTKLDIIKNLQLIKKHVPRPLAELRPDLSPEFCDWVMKMIDKNPDDRHQNAAAAIIALHPSITGRSIPFKNRTPVEVKPTKQRPNRTRRLFAFAASIALLVTMAASTAYGLKSTQTPAFTPTNAPAAEFVLPTSTLPAASTKTATPTATIAPTSTPTMTSTLLPAHTNTPTPTERPDDDDPGITLTPTKDISPGATSNPSTNPTTPPQPTEIETWHWIKKNGDCVEADYKKSKLYKPGPCPADSP